MLGIVTLDVDPKKWTFYPFFTEFLLVLVSFCYWSFFLSFLPEHAIANSNTVASTEYGRRSERLFTVKYGDTENRCKDMRAAL